MHAQPDLIPRALDSEALSRPSVLVVAAQGTLQHQLQRTRRSVNYYVNLFAAPVNALIKCAGSVVM